MTTTSTLNERLHWRYATKAMDPDKPVAQDKVDTIIEAVRMAPTSSGTQPFELFVVTNPDVRTRIRAAAHDQGLVTDGSHLLVFAAWDNYTDARIDDVVQLNKDAAGHLADHTTIPTSKPDCSRAIRKSTTITARPSSPSGSPCSPPPKSKSTTPMEGFEPAEVDRILGLNERGLRSVVLLALGHRNPDGDWLLPMPKVRKSLDALVTTIG